MNIDIRDLFWIIVLFVFFAFSIAYKLGLRQCRHNWKLTDHIGFLTLVERDGDFLRMRNSQAGYKCLKCAKTKIKHECGSEV